MHNTTPKLITFFFSHTKDYNSRFTGHVASESSDTSNWRSTRPTRRQVPPSAPTRVSAGKLSLAPHPPPHDLRLGRHRLQAPSQVSHEGHARACQPAQPCSCPQAQQATQQAAGPTSQPPTPHRRTVPAIPLKSYTFPGHVVRVMFISDMCNSTTPHVGG